MLSPASPKTLKKTLKAARSSMHEQYSKTTSATKKKNSRLPIPSEFQDSPGQEDFQRSETLGSDSRRQDLEGYSSPRKSVKPLQKVSNFKENLKRKLFGLKKVKTASSTQSPASSVEFLAEYCNDGNYSPTLAPTEPVCLFITCVTLYYIDDLIGLGDSKN